MHPDLMTYLATVEPSYAIAWAALIPIIISAIGALRGSGGSSGGASSTSVSSATTDPNMTALLDLQRRRMEMQNPLYEAVQRLAMGLMPTAYQQPVSPLAPPGSTNGLPIPNYGVPGQENPGGRTPWGNPPSAPGGASDSYSFTPEGLRRLPRYRLPPE